MRALIVTEREVGILIGILFSRGEHSIGISRTYCM